MAAAAAAAMPQKDRLSEETACFLCDTFFTHPMMLECGHNFCKGCIFKFWPPEVETMRCPLCRATVQRKAVMSNPQLGLLVDVIRELKDLAMKQKTDFGVCRRHEEPLNFFCQLECAPICKTCKGFKRHKDHPVVPAEAAAEQYKVQINTCVQSLMEDKQDVLAYKSHVEKQSREFIEKIKRERQKAMVAIGHFRKTVEQTQNRLFGQMEEAVHEIAEKRDKDIARFSEEFSSLEKTIQEMEDVCVKPPKVLLKNFKGMFQRYEQKRRFETPVFFPLNVMWKIWDFWDFNPFLENVANKFKEVMEFESPLQKENVTLNPEMAHPQLVISEDRKYVTVSQQWQTRLEGAWSFADHQVVLGSKPFYSGRHFWEVDVGEQEGWAIGISVAQCNKGKLLGPDVGVWAIGKWDGQYHAVMHPLNPSFHLDKDPKKILVSLNYLGGRVTFFDAETAIMLFHFSIPGHLAVPYYPFFWLRMNCKLSLGQ